MSKNLLLRLALVLAILAAYAAWRYTHSASGLNVEPHAAEEIEKAKGR